VPTALFTATSVRVRLVLARRDGFEPRGAASGCGDQDEDPWAQVTHKASHRATRADSQSLCACIQRWHAAVLPQPREA